MPYFGQAMPFYGAPPAYGASPAYGQRWDEWAFAPGMLPQQGGFAPQPIPAPVSPMRPPDGGLRVPPEILPGPIETPRPPTGPVGYTGGDKFHEIPSPTREGGATLRDIIAGRQPRSYPGPRQRGPGPPNLGQVYYLGR